MPRIVGGFEVGRFVPERVLADNGLGASTTTEQLVAAAAPHDGGSIGYLTSAELQRGADDLLAQVPTTPGAPGTTPSMASFDYAPNVLHSVHDEFLGAIPGRTVGEADLVGAAAQWDDGNGYLRRAELEAGARELQITATTGQPLRAADIASIRSWTGCERRGSASTPTPPTPSPSTELGVVSDIDQTIMPKERNGVEPPSYPGVAALFTLLDQGTQGQGAQGDVTYVTARRAPRTVTIAAWLATNSLPPGAVEPGIPFPGNATENEKVADIRRLFLAHPDQRFVLFGDATQRDPETYRRIRDEFPDRVGAVVIHDTKAIDAARLIGHHLVKNYAEAAALLMGDGIIDEAGARSVMEAAQREGLAITDVEIDALIVAHRP